MESKTRKPKKVLSGAHLVGIQGTDLANYKGEFYADQDTKYQDPVTGAHFRYENMCHRLYVLQQQLLQDPFYATLEEPLQTEEAEILEPLEDGGMGQFLFRTQENRPLPETLHKVKITLKPGYSQKSTAKTDQKIDSARHNRQGSCPNYQRGSGEITHKPVNGKGYTLMYPHKGKQLTKSNINLVPKKAKELVETVALFSSM